MLFGILSSVSESESAYVLPTHVRSGGEPLVVAGCGFRWSDGCKTSRAAFMDVLHTSCVGVRPSKSGRRMADEEEDRQSDGNEESR